MAVKSGSKWQKIPGRAQRTLHNDLVPRITSPVSGCLAMKPTNSAMSPSLQNTCGRSQKSRGFNDGMHIFIVHRIIKVAREFATVSGMMYDPSQALENYSGTAFLDSKSRQYFGQFCFQCKIGFYTGLRLKRELSPIPTH